jgi:hypothetical protein
LATRAPPTSGCSFVHRNRFHRLCQCCLQLYQFIDPTSAIPSSISPASSKPEGLQSRPNTSNVMSPSPDLTLPPTYPYLAGYGAYSWSNASFALYSVIKTSSETLEEIAASLDEEWYEEQGNEGTHLIRVASFPMHNSLTDILEVHTALNEVAPGQSEERYGALDLA